MSVSKSTRKNLKYFGVGLLLAFLFNSYKVVAITDYDDAVAYEAFYCEMVDSERWPATDDHPCTGPGDSPSTQIAGL